MLLIAKAKMSLPGILLKEKLARRYSIEKNWPNKKGTYVRGRHQSSCKAGQKTIEALEKLDGVKGVVLGRSYGGKSFHNAYDGAVKLQQTQGAAIYALLRTSKGIQSLRILLEGLSFEDSIRAKILKDFS